MQTETRRKMSQPQLTVGQLSNQDNTQIIPLSSSSGAIMAPIEVTNINDNNKTTSMGPPRDTNITKQQPTEQQPKTTNSSSDIQGTTCMELALEGERLCKTGDLKSGVRFFEEALKVGTSNDRTLSAIYSQLGNAYFYLEDYQKALDYHKRDVALVHSIGDEPAEAKACGNLGNTFKMLAKFDEAAVYCRRYLEISHKLHDQVGEARALYNLGNVYHMKGKRMIGTSEQETGELPSDIESSLQRAIEYYEDNLRVVSALGDQVGMGRAYGNLGNTHYLLGNFQQAVESHEKRLELAKQTHDKSAERRAYLNLGNANVFLGNFTEAIKNYTGTLQLAQQLNDRHTEAQACQSLANTYTFLRDYKSAIEYHTKYFDVIKDIDDKLGEGRACWSLVNIYHIVKDPDSALVYARRHYEIAKQLGDETGLACAKANIEELEDTLAQREAVRASTAANSTTSASSDTTGTTIQLAPGQQQQPAMGESSSINSSSSLASAAAAAGAAAAHQRRNNLVRLSSDKRQEQEQRRFKKQLTANLAPDIDGLAAARRRAKAGVSGGGSCGGVGGSGGGLVRSTSSEKLFDMIALFQSGRIDDQRCDMLKRTLPTTSTPLGATTASALSSRVRALDDKENDNNNNTTQHQQQHSNHPAPSDLASSTTNGANNGGGSITSNSTPRSSQPSLTNPISAAASAIKATYRKASLAAYPNMALSSSAASIQAQRRPTVSAEHRDQLFDLIAGAQNQRMDEQRASLPVLTMANGVLKNPTHAGLLSRGQTLDHTSTSVTSTSSTQVSRKPNTIYEAESLNQESRHPELIKTKERSKSIAPSHQINLNSSIANDYSPMPPPLAPTSAAAATATIAASKVSQQQQQQSRPKMHKLSRHFQTVDSEAPAQDEKFLDSLMKYQSTRFDDQRSEFPKNNNNRDTATNKSSEKGQVDFFNLIVKFQSDRIDDQRSAPPPRSRNL